MPEKSKPKPEIVRVCVLEKGRDRVFTGEFDEETRTFEKFAVGEEFDIARDIADELVARGYGEILYPVTEGPEQREDWSQLAREYLAIRANRSQETGCLVWQGSKNPDGYGTTKFLRKTYSTHRLAWLAHRGEISPGLHVCHRCDNRLCLEPDHLFLGTPQQNTIDMIRKGRSAGFGGKRLAVNDVASIKRRLLNGARIRDLAAEANVSPSTISDIKRGLTWRFVEPE